MITSQDSLRSVYVCSALAGTALVARLAVAKFQPKPFDLSFFLALIGLVCILGRAACVAIALPMSGSVSLLAKTTPDSENYDTLAQKVKTYGILLLMARQFVTTALWCMNALVLLLYKRIVSHMLWTKRFITALSVFIGGSYVAVVLITFLDCRPFELYWRVDTVRACSQTRIQLLAQCMINAIIEVLLMAVAIPVLYIQGAKRSQIVRLALFISLGVFCVIVSCVRIRYIWADDGSLPGRSFWASMSVLISTLVANAPALYGAYTLATRQGKSTSYGNTYGPTDTAAQRSGRIGTRNAEEKDLERAEDPIQVEVIVTQSKGL
ncbi:Hypothetical protein D9617_22g067350 [Elsinoe fawcettii]|nr:Hypothetical protein D9617_22g067350 [Elsinoe fawcettii]